MSSFIQIIDYNSYSSTESLNFKIQMHFHLLHQKNQRICISELPDIHAGFRKVREIGDQIANIHWIIEKAREFQKDISFCFTDYTKAFVWITTNCRKFSEMGRHLTCLLRKLYAGQEATIRTWYGTTDWFQIGKGILWGCVLSPCLFNLYAEYITKISGCIKHKLK